MSHNKITVQNQAPDSAGNISLTSLGIDDLKQVAGCMKGEVKSSVFLISKSES